MMAPGFRFIERETGSASGAGAFPKSLQACRKSLRSHCAISKVTLSFSTPRWWPWVKTAGRFLFRSLCAASSAFMESNQQPVNFALSLHLFDRLFFDGRSLIDEPYESRWLKLSAVAGNKNLARWKITTDIAEAEAFLNEALAAGHEGLMAKALDSPYMPGTRASSGSKSNRKPSIA